MALIGKRISWLTNYEQGECKTASHAQHTIVI